MPTELNCFHIGGLENLNAEYRLFQIAGLQRDTPEFYANIQRIIRRLSFQMKAAVTTYDRDGETFLVIPAGCGDPPDHITLVGAVAALRNTGEVVTLDFTTREQELDLVKLRYLQFVFQGPPGKDPQLWRPGAGKPFFFKKPEKQLGNLELFEGFSMRVTPHPEGGFGLVIDLRRKLVARTALSTKISREQVNKLKGRSCIYKMGHVWFEVSVSGKSDLNVGDRSISIDGNAVSLIDYLHDHASKPVPASIAKLSPDGAAIYYRTNGPNQKSAPAELCYLVEDTHGAEGARHQPETVIAPRDRHRQINSIVKRFFHSVVIEGVPLSVSDIPGRANTNLFEAPALRFGNDTILRVDSKQQGMAAAVKDYGRNRLSLLENEDAGFFERSLLDRQYVVMPKSIANSSGPKFLSDLKSKVEALYPTGGGYDPQQITYDDLNKGRDFVGQSRAIREAIDAAGVKPGCALVMVHRYDRRARVADQLAAWIVKEFSTSFEINAAVIHTDMVRRAYAGITRNGETEYIMKRSEQRRLSGYLRNVALNKVLLTNGKWPFVLESPLYADIVIGIDVKNSTAAFTLLANGGKIIRFATSPSKQKEQLLKNQVAKFVSDLIRKEAKYFTAKPKNVVVHRDGRAWPCEIEGLKEVCAILAEDGHLDQGWELNVLEIAKSAPAPLRLFEVKSAKSGQGDFVGNPFVGRWIDLTEDEGYVCTTGWPFKIPGTANPLHIKRVAGSMPIEHCLADIYSLSCLTWTRPEGAMRLPISIKLCDRSLFDEAADVDEDSIEFGNDNIAGGTQ